MIRALKKNQLPDEDTFISAINRLLIFCNAKYFHADIYSISRAFCSKNPFVVIYFGETHIAAMRNLIAPFYSSVKKFLPISANCLGQVNNNSDFFNAAFCITSKFCAPQISQSSTLLELAIRHHSSEVQIINQMTTSQLANWRSSFDHSAFVTAIFYDNDIALKHLIKILGPPKIRGLFDLAHSVGALKCKQILFLANAR